MKDSKATTIVADRTKKAEDTPSYMAGFSHSKRYKLLLEELEKSKERYDRLLHSAHQGTWEWEKSTRSLTFSSQSYRLLGFGEREGALTLEEWLPHFHPKDHERTLKKIGRLTEEKPLFESEFRCKDKDGLYSWILCRGVGVFVDGSLEKIVGSFTDINRTKRKELVFEVLYKVSMAASHLDEGIGKYLDVVHEALSSYKSVHNFYVALWNAETQAFEAIYDGNEKEHAALYSSACGCGDIRCYEEDGTRKIPGLPGHVIRSGDTCLFTKDSEEIADSLGVDTQCWLGSPIKLGGKILGVLAVQNYEHKNAFSSEDMFLLEAIGEQIARAIDHEQLHKHLFYQANHDSLTGLVNRAYFINLGARLVARKEENAPQYSLLMLDLNRFKQINDSLGHGIGDQVLAILATKIQSQLRKEDTFGRIGGDEFAILLKNNGGVAEVTAVAKRIIDEVQKGGMIDGRMVVTGVSIGIVTNINGYDDIHQVFRDADLAMYEAKHNAPLHFRVFNQVLHAQLQAKIDIDSILTNEFCEDEFTVVYQPIVDIKKQKVDEFEALIRWNSKKLGFVGPDQFLPVAEENGLISKIDGLVLERICKDLCSWRKKDPLFKDIRVSINISQHEFIDAHLAKRIIAKIAEYDLPPSAIVVEMTETALMENLETGKRILTELADQGVSIHIDDFGTGYSSFAHLADLPFDALKIDKSFLAKALESAQHRTILEALVRVTDSLNISAIAEGVETVELLELLDSFGCEYAQGYFFSKPMPSAEVVGYCQNFEFMPAEELLAA